jgi:DNA polymerase-3 subunit delta
MLVRENRVWGPRERLIGPALSRVTEPALERALALAARLDRQVKGLSGGTPGSHRHDPPPDPWDGLFDLAMTVAAPKTSSAPPPRPRPSASAPARGPV